MSEQATSFGEQLRRFREAAGLTQEELAERAGLAADAVGALERGKRRRPYPHTVRLLAEALALDASERASLVAAVPRRAVSDHSATAPIEPFAGPRIRLPGYLTGLVGRERETAVVLQLLGRSDVRLLTLTGPGGVGKTRLAIRSAEMAAGDFRDGVVFVSLTPLRDAVQVAGVIAAALDVREASHAASLQHLAAILHDRQLLLVLDNFEHVAEAAPAVTHLLLACPGLKALATSRVPLHVQGEQEYRVPPLELPSTTQSTNIEVLKLVPAVQLFVTRAQSSLVAFELTTTNAEAVAAICTRLDGLPLAIELAAARVSLLPPAALLARLDRGLGVLAGGPRDLPARQQTMRATVAWSYDLLDVPQQAFFRRLAVFAGGATLDAVETICGSDSTADVFDQLTSLLDGNLLVHESGRSEEWDEPTVPRVRMLEPIRDFAWEQLTAHDELRNLQRRHAAYYHALALEASRYLAGPNQLTWINRLAPERYNLHAAVRTLLDNDDIDAAVDLAWSLQWRYCWLTGQHGEARRWAEEALSGTHGTLSPLRRAHALLTIGLAWSGDDDTAAVAALEVGMNLCREVGDIRNQAVALVLMGLLTVSEGDGSRSASLSEECLSLFRAVGEEWGASFALVTLGIGRLVRGDYRQAAGWFDEGLRVARSSEDQVAIHRALYYLGLLALTTGDIERAIEHFSDGLVLAGELRDQVNAGYFIKHLAEVGAVRGRPAGAARLFGAAEVMLEATGSPLYRDVPGQPWHERAVAAVRATLRDEEYQRAWQAGRGLSLKSAIAEALVVASPNTSAALWRMTTDARLAVIPETGETLTPREHEVLHLMAAGLSNAEIAAQLYIGIGTVKTHVNRIFAKLAAESRTQAVARARSFSLLDGHQPAG